MDASCQPSQRPRLEIACFNLESVLVADAAGADRVEFCNDRSSGGTTPDLQSFIGLRYRHRSPIMVMVRPRSGNFVYSELEFDTMKADMRKIISLGGIADGFVFGILDNDGRVDVTRNSELVRLAEPFPCTFHRAFDATRDLNKALEDVIACRFKTLLTSGGAADASAGYDNLVRLVKDAKGRIAIMPGGGVRSSNIKHLLGTQAQWYHSAAILERGENVDGDEVRSLKINLLDR